VLPRDPRPGRFPEPPEGELPYDRDLVSAIGSQFSDPDPTWWASLARIACPTLIIGGGSTSHVPQQLLAEAAELIPDARLVTLEGAGHTAHRTQPERFAAQVRVFIGGLVAGA
jgi:pimeloyl-ACP methyl ester carboxylesterase